MRIDRFFQIFSYLLAILLTLAISGAKAEEGSRARPASTASDTWVATDELGRVLPGYKECGPPKAGRTVGIFYFLWMDRQINTPIFDITKLLAANPTNPKWGPETVFHWWGEPHLGYYVSDDLFVIRKHAQLLSDAGVDVVIFDVTNIQTYDDTYREICKLYEQIRREGGKTPQIAFMVNSRADQVTSKLYETFYAKNLHSDLWFRWRGKPLILSPINGVDPKVFEFFTMRHSWAWTDREGWFGNGKDKWPWLDHYPQKAGWHERPDKPEALCVCVAEHPISNIGRSFHGGKEPPLDQHRPQEGLCFAEQWERALQVDPEFIFITGWNEWIAQRFVKHDPKEPGKLGDKPIHKGDTYFVDAYSQEFSRDIEPMRGGHGDNYYYQMVANIRRYKGVSSPPKASGPKTIAIDHNFRQWDDVAPSFADDLHDTAHRFEPGYGHSGPYVNQTGRNDLDLMKVAHDPHNVYFYVRTREPITEPAGSHWMCLLLDIDGKHETGWEGYDVVVNRDRLDSSTCLVERYKGDGRWERAGTANFLRNSRELHLALPRNLLGTLPKADHFQVDFKWVDNVPGFDSILDFIDKGDVAPNARFNYRYEAVAGKTR